MTTEAPDVRSRLLEAATLVGTARSLIAEGKVVDLDGLEGRIEGICAALPGLPDPERDALKPALIALMDGLGGLAEAVKEQHAILAERLSTVSKGHRAVSAYGAGASTSRPRDKR